MTENIRVGDLVLFKPKNIFSKLLCKINKTKYTHAAMIYSVDDEILIFDTDYYLTQICNLSIYEKENYDIYILMELHEFNLNDELLKEAFIKTSINRGTFENIKNQDKERYLAYENGKGKFGLKLPKRQQRIFESY